MKGIKVMKMSIMLAERIQELIFSYLKKFYIGQKCISTIGLKNMQGRGQGTGMVALLVDHPPV